MSRAQIGEIEEAGVLDDASVQREDGGEDFERKIGALRWGVATSTVAIPLVPLARRRRWVSAWV